MPRLLWLMFQVPMSSPPITRLFGFCLGVWVSGVPIDVTGLGERADAAASVVPASRMLRLLSPWQQELSGVDFVLMRLLLHRPSCMGSHCECKASQSTRGRLVTG